MAASSYSVPVQSISSRTPAHTTVKMANHMIRNLCFSTAALFLALLASCNKDGVITDGGAKPVITLDNPEGVYTVKVGKSVTIAPTVGNAEGAVYTWLLDDEPAGSGPTFTFEAREAGVYYLTFRVENPNGSASEELRIEVNRLQPPVISFPVGDDKVMEVEIGRETTIAPTIANGDGATFVWTLAGETVGTDATYTFTPEELANFQLTLSAENEDGKSEPESITIRVVERFTVTAVFPAPSLRFGKEGARNVSLGRTLYLRPVLEHFHNPTFEWTVKDRPEKGDKEVFAFTPAAEGEYTVTVKVTDDDGETATATAVVTCCGDEMSHKRSGGTGRFSDKVYEYTPAPGQFINESVFKDITSADAAASKAQELLRQNAGEKKNYYVSLGAWGGYIVVGFDHSIENKGGNDFSIAGNQFAQSSEPGIVWVMQDTNGNGLPDDEWYELKGSEYGKPETLTSYAMIYYRPKSDNTGIQWKDNRGNAGTVERNSSHEQGYYPGWIDMESYTLYGTRLAANTTRHPITGDYYNNPYDWGYADNAGSDQAAGNVSDGDQRKNYFKIANAVNADGSAANLKYIDFIKVQTGISQNSGPLGEVSTEVFAFEDENL